jgi:phage repressor protein C with HTH and peptisase S24 domain
MSNIGVITVDDSIQGMYKTGDIVEVDLDVKSYKGEGKYAFQLGGSKFIARLQSIPNDGLYILLANYGYKNFKVEEDMNFEIIGKAIKQWVVTYTA